MTGDPQADVFILQPQNDRAARSALLFYATEIQYHNPALAVYLRAWVGKLYEADEKERREETAAFPEWLLEQQRDGNTIYPKS